MHVGNRVRERGATRKGQLSRSIGTVKDWKFELRRNLMLASEPKRLNPEARSQGCTWTRCRISERFTRSCFNLNRKAVSIRSRLAAFRRAVAERSPLPPSIAYRYQLGSYDTTGFIELTPDFRLNVVTPIYDARS